MTSLPGGGAQLQGACVLLHVLDRRRRRGVAVIGRIVPVLALAGGEDHVKGRAHEVDAGGDQEHDAPRGLRRLEGNGK